MKNINNKKMCEEATGCVQQGRLVFYDSKGNKITPKEASDLLNNFEMIEVPASGAGSYSEVFESLGFEEVKTVETTSSAGDWGLAVKAKAGWFLASQENRYPYHGFKYVISDDYDCYDSFEELCEDIFY